jgi:hypothetical protein
MTVTSLVAVYRAVLSTVKVLWDYLSRRTKAVVRTGYEVKPGVAITAETDPPFAFVAKIANTGRESIFVARAGAQTTKGTMVTVGYSEGGDPLPRELRPGQSLAVYLPFQTVQSIANPAPHRLIRAVFIDQLGRRYYGDFVVAALATKTATGWELDTPRTLSPLERLMTRFSRRRLKLAGK